MKRFVLFLLCMLVAGGLFAATNRTLNEKPFVEWEFKPSVSTYAGYNLDLGTVGLVGEAKLELTAKIFPEADVEFEGEQKPYGYIKVKDLEIKAGTGEQLEDYNTTDAEKDEPLTITWGGIEGVVYIGPVYIKLAHDGHGDQGLIEDGLDDGDLDYSVINYSVVKASDTAQHKGTRKENDPPLQFPVDVEKYTPLYITDITDSSTLAPDVAGTNNALSVGFKLDDLMDLRIGISSDNSYKDWQKRAAFQMSLYFELLAVQNLVFKLQATALMGAGSDAEDEPNALMEHGNPITAGILLGYALPMGTFTLTPSIGFELRIENKVPEYGSVTLIEDNPETAEVDDPIVFSYIGTAEAPTVDTMSYEGALGVKFDWKSLGHDANESDHLSAPDEDVKVTDGVSLGVLYGSMPHGIFRKIMVPYLGAKIAMWDSQDSDKPGILPLKLGLILNYNMTLGAEGDIKDFGNPNLTVSKVKLGSRSDLGALLETSMTFGYVTPYVKAAVRMLGLSDEGVEVTTVGATNGTFKSTDLAYGSEFRLKLGVDIAKIVPNTTFKVWWESGNLMDNDDVIKDESYNTATTFYNIKDSLGVKTAGKMGYIALGAEISY